MCVLPSASVHVSVSVRYLVSIIHLRTTLMVGHPGETEADFEELKEFVRKVRFDRMGFQASDFRTNSGTFPLGIE